MFLSDFASFKPKSVRADNPADFTFYFDAGGRRRCYLAPERFVDSNANSSNINNDSSSNLQELEMEKEKEYKEAREEGVKDILRTEKRTTNLIASMRSRERWMCSL